MPPLDKQIESLIKGYIRQVNNHRYGSRRKKFETAKKDADSIMELMMAGDYPAKFVADWARFVPGLMEAGVTVDQVASVAAAMMNQ